MADSFTITITEAQAREIFKTLDAAMGEGQGGDTSFLERAIADAFPHIKEEHSYFPWPTSQT